MKKIILFYASTLFALCVNAQIKPPCQTDTLFVTSVKYNFAKIRPENWPCDTIYKSTTHFSIAGTVFQIISVSENYPGDVRFFVSDVENERYILDYNERLSDILIKFSGYEFSCKLARNIDDKPSFMGGDANAFSEWVSERLKYPKAAKKNGTKGRVMLQFTIDTDGSVTNVTVLKGADPALDKEAVRVVSMSPKWTPGKIKGKPVKVTYTFPVIFQRN